MGTAIFRTKWVKVAASLTMLLLVAVSFDGNADKVGQEYTETGFKRALVTFASARAINGLISVAQGTEVAVQPAGVGAVFTPGEILDPVNDLVEQFSPVMLFSAAGIGDAGNIDRDVGMGLVFRTLGIRGSFLALDPLAAPSLHAEDTADRVGTLGIASAFSLPRTVGRDHQ